MGKGILIPEDVTDVHKMFRSARSKPDWFTELGKAFTMAGYNLAIIGAGCLNCCGPMLYILFGSSQRINTVDNFTPDPSPQ